MLDTIDTEPAIQGAVVPNWTGVVRYLHITPRAFLPMRAMPELRLIEGKGIEGDRYMIGREEEFYSHKPEEGRQVTLFEFETLVALKRDANIELGPGEHRRNVTVEGVPLTHLVGRQFWLGETLLEATRLSIPLPAHRGHHGESDLRSAHQQIRAELQDPEGRNSSGRRCRAKCPMKAAPITTIKTIVDTIEDAGAGVKLFSLVDPDHWDLPPFRPGAHIDLHLPGGMVRTYSLCNDPADNRCYRI